MKATLLLTVFFAQCALIVGFLIHRVAQRRPGTALQASESALRPRNQQVQPPTGRLIAAQSWSARIARELHDDVSQKLAVLWIDLNHIDDAMVISTAKTPTECLS